MHHSGVSLSLVFFLTVGERVLKVQGIAVLPLLAVALLAVGASSMTLVQEGKPVSIIVTGDDPVPSQKVAAEELQYHLEKMTGAVVPIVAEKDIGENDGPFATLGRAKQAAREIQKVDPQAAVRVIIRGGTYYLYSSLEFGPEDSGTQDAPVICAASSGEEVVISGGRRLEGGTWGEVKGRKAWVVDIPEVKEGKWRFRQLFVNGERRPRTRLPGALLFDYAERCAVTDSVIEHISNYGVEVNVGCSDIEISRNRITDIGAGGIRIGHFFSWETDGSGRLTERGLRRKAAMPQGPHSRRITVADNVIAHCGRFTPEAAGVFVGDNADNKVIHNHIYDLFWSGICVGSVQDFGPSQARGNVIEYNHVHDVGQGMLSDVAGIYTCSTPDSRIAYNVVHDVTRRDYGGWGIYPDQGSHELLIRSTVISV